MTSPSPDYCTVSDVAALTIYTRGRQFFDSPATNPSLSTVKTWITQMSRLMDAALASRWFTIPVPATNTNVIALLAPSVARIVADMVDDANSAGRFFSERVLENGLSKMAMIQRDLADFIERNEDGLVAMGLAQNVVTGQKGQVRMRMIGINQIGRTGSG